MDNKLNKYNQRLLAIIGSIVLFGLVLLLFLGGFALINELISDMSRDRDRDNSLTVNTVENNNNEEFKIRHQEISFSDPRLIDTLKNVYLIPVSQVNLEDPEIVQNEGRGIAALTSGSGYRKYSGYSYSGSYNNIVIYERLNNTKTPVFKTKVNINSFRNYFIQDKQYLLITGTSFDSNKDGKLNRSDLQSFFIYDIEANNLKTISFENMGFKDFYIPYESGEIILSFVKDKDTNGEINEYREPNYLKLYSVSNSKTTDLVDKELIDSMQALIE